MALDLKVPSLFGNRGGINTILRETYFKIGESLVVNVPGAPKDEHPEGTFIFNTGDNKLYCRTLGGGEIPSLLHFELNEGSGLSCTDKTGNGNTGTVTLGGGDYDKWVIGKYDKGLDTEGGADCRIHIDGTAALEFPGDCTCELWFYRTTAIPAVNSVDIFHRTNTAGNQYFDFKIATILSGQRLNFMMQDGGSQTWLESDNLAATDLPLNTWVHITFTRTGGTAKIFINGVDVTSGGGAVTETPIIEDVNDFIIAGRIVGGDYGCLGIIDEVKIWSSGRSAAQIQADMLPPTQLHWAHVDLTI